MRFLMLYTPAAGSGSGPPDPAQGVAMGKYSQEMSAAGVLLDQGMLDPEVSQVRLHSGQATVTGHREQVAGYAFIQAQSREEAIECAKQFMGVAGDGLTEIRPLAG